MKAVERKQAEYEAAWQRTKDPLVAYEAVQHATSAGQPLPRWLVGVIGDILMCGRTDEKAERFRERMRHVQRYRCVRDLRRKGNTKDSALDLAVEALNATDAAGNRSTVMHSYDRVNKDLKRKGRASEFALLVAQNDPARVPVLATRRSDGVTVINRVPLSPGGGTDRSPNDQEG